jgi:hypothetical protein
VVRAKLSLVAFSIPPLPSWQTASIPSRNGGLSMKAKLFNYLITLIIVGLAVWAAVSLSIVGTS